MLVGGKRHVGTTLPPGKRPGTYPVGGWVGFGAVLDG
jgi:hypothetical protein